MRENRLSGSEGGGTGTTRSPYPYPFPAQRAGGVPNAAVLAGSALREPPPPQGG